MFYILDENHEAVPVEVALWSAEQEKHNCVVRKHRVFTMSGGKILHTAEISTVFLGTDMGIGLGVPLLFETMVFGGPWDHYQLRCSTWKEAEEQHEDVRWMVRNEPIDKPC